MKRLLAGWLTGTALLGLAASAAPPAAEVDPQMAPVLEALKGLGAKPLHTLTPAQARKGPTPRDAVASLVKQQGKAPAPEPLAQVEDKTLPGPQGPLPFRVYTPAGEGPFPMVVYFHGGGFVIANKDIYDAGPRALSTQAQAVVVSLDYRLAPEHAFPAALDDADAAFRYIQAHAAQFKGDPQRVAVAGESAGGNLAAAVSLRQKAAGGKLPIFQLLVYPFVSNNISSPSHVANGQGNYILGNEDIAWFWKHDLGKNWQANKDPEALPIYATAEQLKGLEPAMVITAGLDPLKDEGQEFARKLKAAGVQVQVKNYDGVTHEFFGMAAVIDKAKQAQADAAGALKAAFAQARPGTGGSGPVVPQP